MAYRFRRKESAARGIHRIMREEAANVVSLLADHGNDLPERIHEARRGLKRLRAVLRLIRHDIDGDTATAEDLALRDVGKQLSVARDAEAALGIFERLASKLSEPALSGIRTHLLSAVAGTRKRGLSRAALENTAAAVRAASHTLGQTSIATDDWRLIREGLEESYSAARRMRKAAKHDPTPETLHEWRKLVKRAAFQLQLLCRALTRRERKQLERLVKLGDLLGKANDLELLVGALSEIGKPGTRTVPALDAALAHAAQKTRNRIFKLAQEAFTMSPDKYIAALSSAWKRLRSGKR